MPNKIHLAEGIRQHIDLVGNLSEAVPGINLVPDEPPNDTRYHVDVVIDVEDLAGIPDSARQFSRFELWIDRIMKDLGLHKVEAGLDDAVGDLHYDGRSGKNPVAVARMCREIDHVMMELTKEYRKRHRLALTLNPHTAMAIRNPRLKWWTHLGKPDIDALATGKLTMGQIVLRLQDDGRLPS